MANSSDNKWFPLADFVQWLPYLRAIEMGEEVSYRVTMRASMVDVFLLIGAGFLSVLALDYFDSVRLISPLFQLLREHIVGVVIGVAVLVAVRFVTYAPDVRWR